MSVVRSLTHRLGVHDDATHWLQTGYPLLNARQRGEQHPSQGSVVSYFRDTGSQQIPPYVCIPEDYQRHAGFYESAAFLSARHNALNAGGDPSLGNYRPPEFSLPGDVDRSRMSGRRVRRIRPRAADRQERRTRPLAEGHARGAQRRRNPAGAEQETNEPIGNISSEA